MPRKIEIRKDLDPLVKKLFYIKEKCKLSNWTLADIAGISGPTIGSWNYRGTDPSLISFKACLNAMNYDIIIVSKGKDIEETKDIEIMDLRARIEKMFGSVKRARAELDTIKGD